MSSTACHTFTQLREFTEIRDWDQFHSHQKLTMAFSTNEQKYLVDEAQCTVNIYTEYA